MELRSIWPSSPLVLTLAGVGMLALCTGCGDDERSQAQAVSPPVQDAVHAHADQLIDEGRQTFRSDTFGDQTFWGDTIKLHQAIAGSAHGGVGSGVSPRSALSVGLKVDSDALPNDVQAQIKNGTADLNDAATTLALLKLNAVVGVTGFFDASGKLTSMGIQCALCHSTVDDAFSPGIGKRLDGWANRDLNVGAIVALAPDLSAVAQLLKVDEGTVRTVLNAWGPGKFDAQILLDGKGFRPDGGSSAVLIPPAFGLAGVNLATSTGFGSVTYWNAFVANIEMHGQGTFSDARLNNATQFPIASPAGFASIQNTPDNITSKLAALHFYQLAIAAPTPPSGSFDPQAAARGAAVFSAPGRCATCHVPPLFTEPGWNMHTPEEMGLDDFQASRAPDRGYRTAPLKGLWTHSKGGFFHDGRFPTLAAVVDHYNSSFGLGLTSSQKSDLIEYLKSL